MTRTPLEGSPSGTQELADVLAELNDTISSLQDWMRVLAQPVLQEALRDMFSNPKQLRAYELSDGSRSTREIGVLVGADQKTVSNWWRKWEADYGIVEKAGTRGQFRRRYSFLDLMILFGQADQSKARSQSSQGAETSSAESGVD